jgi:biopolymer transport protein ExbD
MGMRLAGGGHGRYELGQNSEINVTPFVDVMLVLLIIFMMAIPAATVSVKLDLPQSGLADQPSRPPVYVSLQRGGGLYVGDRPTSLAGLTGAVAQALGVAEPTRERIYLRADKGLAYGEVMAVIDALQAGGYRRVGLVSEQL